MTREEAKARLETHMHVRGTRDGGYRVQIKGRTGTVLYSAPSVQCEAHLRNTITAILDALFGEE